VSVIGKPSVAGRGPIPALEFSVEGSGTLEHAATPTLTFALRVAASDGRAIRSVLLDVQIQIAARQRRYDPDVQDRLLELFGPVKDWGRTLRTLPWLRLSVVVPPFTGSTLVELRAPCTYDLEVAGARYFAALRTGFIPLEFVFSGSTFFAGEDGALQTARIGWDHEVAYRLPVSVWRQTMERHFPDSAWLRLGQQSFGRLTAFKARGAFTTWDAAIDALLDETEGR